MAQRYPADAPFIDGGGSAISNAAWIHLPDLSAVAGQPNYYWITQAFPDDTVTLMDQAARDAVDAQRAADKLAADRAGAIALNTEEGSGGMHIRELFEVFNKRDNYMVNRIIELQNALVTLVQAAGNANARIDTLPASYLATATRTRQDAIQDYEDDINAGGAD
jgi:thioesterase domain-containing protein